jgi:hypothetical protein
MVCELGGFQFQLAPKFIGLKVEEDNILYNISN